MARAEFRYSSLPVTPSKAFPQFRTVWRPVVAATLAAATGKTLRCAVLLDSGADNCAFPAVFASVLGLDLLQMPTSSSVGIGGTAITYHDWLDIDLGQGVRFRSYVAFTPGLQASGYGLLGQEGFFEYHDVMFQHRQRRFTIETT